MKTVSLILLIFLLALNIGIVFVLNDVYKRLRKCEMIVEHKIKNH